jgi:hypothetical protein
MIRNDNYKIPLFQFESLGISEGVLALATCREGDAVRATTKP